MIVLDHKQKPVTALAYSPDGRLLATGDGEGNVWLWDPFTGREVRECGHVRKGMPVSSVSFSRDGKWLAAGFLGEATVWSVASGKVLHWHRLTAVENFLPDSTLVAFHSCEERLAVTDTFAITSIVELHPLRDYRFRMLTPPEKPSHSWEQAPDMRALLSTSEGLLAGSTDYVFFWGNDGDTHQPLALHWPNGDFVALAADTSGRWLAGGRGRGVALWDLHHPAPHRTRTFKLGDQVNAVALTPDGRTLLAGGDDWTVHVWDVSTGQKRTDYNWRLGPVSALAMSPDGMTAAVTGRNGTQVLIWDLE